MYSNPIEASRNVYIVSRNVAFRKRNSALRVRYRVW